MTKSLWFSYSDTTDFPQLDRDISVDVAIIGGGIAGVTTAQLLSEQGISVALLEKDRVGMNSTGNSTGNLYTAVSEILNHVRKRFGDGVMEMIINSRRDAIELVEANISRFGIDCDFKRVPWNYYTTIKASENKIEKAFEAATKINLKVKHTDMSELPFKVLKGIRMDEAAQFNPLRYVQGLARAIAGDNCLFFENSEVKDIDDSSDEVIIKTSKGFSVRARSLVHATHTPKGISAFHAELGPYREYGVACKINGKHPEGVYFGYFVPSDITSTRLYERNGEQFLVVVGEPHKVGHGDNAEHLKRLEEFARKHFDVIEVTHKWGAQNYKAPDYVPYIGPKISGSNIYVASGFSTHGLTYGVVAGQVLSDLIAGKDNPYSEIYKPSRLNPVKSAPKLIKENVDVFAQYVKDYIFKSGPKSFDEVPIGEGKVISQDGHKFAVYRGEHEELKICSAICTHMGCVVHWNNAESSWDCPCHGSRFSTDGEVLEGPALKALATLDELTGTSNKVAYGNNVTGITPDLTDQSDRTDQQHVMSDDELIDEASIESFPASDPPGYSSRSKVDRDQHRHSDQ